MKKIIYAGITMLCVFGIYKLCCIRWQASEDAVSGIVYDSTFNDIISGNTFFKIRASAEMAVTKETSRTYCLPPGHEDTEIVRKAASNKAIKVTLTTDKFFGIMDNPWDCPSIVHVKEIEEDK